MSRGEALPQSKLEEADVRYIRWAAERRQALRAEARQLSNAAIAAELGVHEKTVEKVLAGRSWGHVL